MKELKHKNLLVENDVNSVKRRLNVTLENIKHQKGTAFIDDIEKIEHCIKALENIKIEEDNFNKVYNSLLEENKYYIEKLY